jgi:protocatechuate 3,4-dioxygenase beta subunit
MEPLIKRVLPFLALLAVLAALGLLTLSDRDVRIPDAPLRETVDDAEEPAGAPPENGEPQAEEQEEPRPQVAGIVVDKEGHAIEGVLVELFRSRRISSRIPAEENLLDACVTPPDGSFRLCQPGRLGPDERLEITATKEGFPVSWLTLQGAREDLRIVMLPGAALVVTVVEAETGEALPGAIVAAWPSDPSRGPGRWTSTGACDDSGTARLSVVTGSVRVTATFPGRPTAGRVLTVEGGGVNRVRMDIHKGPRVRLFARDASSGQPIEGARLRDESGKVLAVTDAKGMSEINSPPDRFGHLVLSKPFYRDYLIGGILVTQGTVARVAEMQPAGLVRGAVLDAAGEPVEGAIVSASPRPSPSGAHSTLSLEDGSFTLGGAPPGETVRLHAWKEEVARGVSDPLTVSAGEEITGVVIRLEPARRLILVPVTKEGAPPWGCSARVSKAGAGSRAHPFRGPAGGGALRLRDGEILLWDLPEGPFEVFVEAAGFATTTLRSEDLPPPSAAEVPRVTLLLKKGRVSISGTVLDAEGKAVAGARVVCDSQTDRHLRSARTTDEEGRFEISGLRAGSYRVSAHKTGILPSCAEENVPAGTRDLTLQPAGMTYVTGEILGPDGRPASASITVRRPGAGYPRSSCSMSRGSFCATIEPGVWWFAFHSSEWGSPEPKKVVVNEGFNRLPAVRLPEPTELRGVVRGPGGPIEGAQILTFPAAMAEEVGFDRLHGQPLVGVRTGPDGAFRLLHLGPGRWLLCAGAAGHVARMLEVRLPAAGVASEVDLYLARGSCVEALVLDPEGTPLPCRLELEAAQGEAALEQALPGLFRHLERVRGRPSGGQGGRSTPRPPGSYVARITLNTGRPHAPLLREVRLSLGAEETRELTVRLSAEDMRFAVWVQEEWRTISIITSAYRDWREKGERRRLEVAHRYFVELRDRTPEGHWERLLRQEPVLEATTSAWGRNPRPVK